MVLIFDDIVMIGSNEKWAALSFFSFLFPWLMFDVIIPNVDIFVLLHATGI